MKYLKLFESYNSSIIDIHEILGVELSDIKNICNIMSDESISYGIYVRIDPRSHKRHGETGNFSIRFQLQWEISKQHEKTDVNLFGPLFNNVLDRLKDIGIPDVRNERTIPMNDLGIYIINEPEEDNRGCSIIISLGSCDSVNIELSQEEVEALNVMLEMGNLEEITDDDNDVDIMLGISISDGLELNYEEWNLFGDFLDEDLDEVFDDDIDVTLIYNLWDKMYYPRFK